MHMLSMPCRLALAQHWTKELDKGKKYTIVCVCVQVPGVSFGASMN